MTIRLESKTEDGVTYVKIKGQGGAWGRPVVDDQGNFYRSLRVAADAMNVSVASLREAVARSELCSNRLFAYATEEEIGKALAKPESDSTPKPKGDAVFCGVRWPDGSVTVRLATQSQAPISSWSMSRSSIADLPSEVLSACSWL